MWWLLIIVLLLGASFGSLITKIFNKRDPITSGVLRVDSSDPYDGPHLFVELHKNPKMIALEKYVTFEVNAESYLSQRKQTL